MIIALTGTVAPYAGLVAVTTGAAVCGSTAVRNELWYGKTKLPLTSCAVPSRNT